MTGGPTRPVAVFIGPPGAGKTTVGALLADELGLPFADTDEMVAECAGKSAADIFIEDGEPRFRELEVAAVTDALATCAGVVSLGGGAILAEATQQALTGHRVVFLDVDISDGARRAGFNRDRPLLLGNPRAKWLALMEKRRPVYERLATATFSTTGRTPEDVVADVRAGLQL